ncbi:hypothetical protein [Pseudomonas nitroreducens]|uniref:hypothetical protein n=1 Tax=Pseudomonas nitroreducens TaxID=46680 RepID=UPI00351D871E
MILRIFTIIVFALLAAGLQFFTVNYGHWAEGPIIVAASVAALICAFLAGGMSAFDDRAQGERKEG